MSLETSEMLPENRFSSFPLGPDVPQSPGLDPLSLEDDSDSTESLDIYIPTEEDDFYQSYTLDGDGSEYDVFDSPIDDAPFLLSSDSDDDDDIPHIPEDVFEYEEEFIRDLWRAEADNKVRFQTVSFLDTMREYRKSEKLEEYELLEMDIGDLESERDMAMQYSHHWL